MSLVDLSSANGGIWGVNEFLVLSPTYLLKSGTTDENLTEELANHRLEVYYDANENTNTSTLTLNLRYTISGATAPEEGSDAEHWADEYTVPYTDAVYVRLSDVISQYQANNSGNDPEKLLWNTKTTMALAVFLLWIPTRNSAGLFLTIGLRFRMTSDPIPVKNLEAASN